jgi:hypothetical protein
VLTPFNRRIEMSKKDELKELKKLQSHNEKSREGMAASYRKRCFKIIELETQIADEAKPKLRHGDYGTCTNGLTFVISGNTHDAIANMSINTRETWGANSGTGLYNTATVLGNIFDDLKALQENVTEFEYENTRFEIGDDEMNANRIKMTTHEGKKEWWLTLSPALILGLQQMQATQQREAAAK